MAIPFDPDSHQNHHHQDHQQMKLMLDLYAALQRVIRSRSAQHPSRNHRAPRRSNGLESRQPLVILVQHGNTDDLSNLPLPDLVQSAVDQLPPMPPQVTVSVPNSPMRDAAFQFPECSNLNNDGPLPSPRPRPRRRRLTSEGSVIEKSPIEVVCNSNTCCCYLGQNINERQWASVGANLRNIAGDFHASKTKDGEIDKSRLSSMISCPSGARGRNLSSIDNLLSLLIPAPLRETLWATVALYLGWRIVSSLR